MTYPRRQNGLPPAARVRGKYTRPPGTSTTPAGADRNYLVAPKKGVQRWYFARGSPSAGRAQDPRPVRQGRAFAGAAGRGHASGTAAPWRGAPRLWLLRCRFGAATAALRRADHDATLGCRQGPFGVGLGLFLGDQLVAFGGNLANAPQHAAGARRDQATNDDILLEAFEQVGLAVHRGLGQHARGLLEGGRRNEAARLQGGLGDTQQDRLGRRHTLAGLLDRQVSLVELDAIDLLALEQVGLARILDLHLLQHLAHDHLDVLVVNGDALQPVDILDLVDQVIGEFLHALDRQDVVRRGMSVIDEVTLLDAIAVLNGEALAARDQIFDGLGILIIGLDGDALLVLVVLAELDRAGDLRDDGVVLRAPGLKQLRHARQTTGDVAGLGR